MSASGGRNRTARSGRRLETGVNDMAKKQPKIRVVSYVQVGDELVETSQLAEEQKRELATWMKTTYLNHLFAGQATFRPAEQ